MVRPLLAPAAALPLLAACETYTPDGVTRAPLDTPPWVDDADRRQAELTHPTFGTTADHGQGAPLPVPLTEPLATGGEAVLGATALPPVRVSPAAPTVAMTEAFNRQTRAMILAAEAPLGGGAAPETVAAEPLESVTDTTAVAAFALATDHAVGTPLYARRSGGISDGTAACDRYETADEAQRAFLAVGGPESDPLGLDPDGDGFACAWSPEPYRRMVGD